MDINVEDIVWGEEPPVQSRPRLNTRWSRMTQPFLTRQDQWARLPGTYNPGMATMIRRGKVKLAAPADQWEIVARAAEDQEGRKRVRLWVRYIGPQAA